MDNEITSNYKYPVTKIEFTKIVDFVINKSNLNIIMEECQKHSDKIKTSTDIIRTIGLFEQWQDGAHVVAIDQRQLGKAVKRLRSSGKDLKPTTLNGHSVAVRDIIRVACQEIPFEQDLYIESQEGEETYLLYWKESEGRYLRNVCLLTADWRDEYIDEMVRGFVSMGESLGIVPDIIRVPRRDQIPKSVFDLINTYKGRSFSIAIPMAVSGKVRKWIDDQIELIEGKKSMTELLEESNTKMFITTLGYDRALVSWDNVAAGTILGNQVALDAKHKGEVGGTVLVLSTEQIGDNDPYATRREYFISQIKHKARHLKVIESSAFSFNGLDENHTKCEITWDELFGYQCLAKASQITSHILKTQKDVIAIYGHSMSMVEGIIYSLRELDLVDKVGVYMDYLSPTSLKLLGNPQSPIKAAICIDPFHFGRLSFRVAVTRKFVSDRGCEPVHPQILTKNDATTVSMNHPCFLRSPGISYMSELPLMFPKYDICLEDRNTYVWSDWMEKRLGNSFGPLLRDKRKEMVPKLIAQARKHKNEPPINNI